MSIPVQIGLTVLLAAGLVIATIIGTIGYRGPLPPARKRARWVVTVACALSVMILTACIVTIWV